MTLPKAGAVASGWLRGVGPPGRGGPPRDGGGPPRRRRDGGGGGGGGPRTPALNHLDPTRSFTVYSSSTSVFVIYSPIIMHYCIYPG